MKKQVFLSIALLTSIAGCTKKKKPKKVTENIDLFSTVDIPLAKNTQEKIPEDTEVLSFFDDNLGEFAFADSNDDDDFDIALASETEDTTQQERSDLTWVDTVQQEDIKTIYFGFNKYGVTPDQREIAKADAQVIKELLEDEDDSAEVIVEGHACHSAGAASYNMGISEKRAKYIEDLLVAEGISTSRIHIVGRGQEVPALVDGKPATGNREAQWPNRRVEIRIVDHA